MRLGREHHKAIFQRKRNEINQMQQEIANWTEKEQSSREKKSKCWGNRGRILAGKRRAWSSKEQTKEESARLGTSVVLQLREECEAASNVGNTGAMYVHLRKLGKERTQGNSRNNNNKREDQGAFWETDRRKIREPERKKNISKWGDGHLPGTSSNGGKWFIESGTRWRGDYQRNEECEGIHPGKGRSKNDIHQGIRRWDGERSGKDG